MLLGVHDVINEIYKASTSDNTVGAAARVQISRR